MRTLDNIVSAIQSILNSGKDRADSAHKAIERLARFVVTALAQQQKASDEFARRLKIAEEEVKELKANAPQLDRIAEATEAIAAHSKAIDARSQPVTHRPPADASMPSI